MANVGETIGNDMLLYVKSGASWVPVAMSTSASLEIARDLIEINHKGSGKWKTNITAQMGWSVSSDGVYGYTDPHQSGTTQFNLFDLMSTGTNVLIKIAGRSDGVYASEESGDKYYEGYAKIATLSQSFPINDVATYSVALTGSGELELKTVV